MESNHAKRELRRGDIYYVASTTASGSEQKYNRPAIIVSNDYCNTYSDVVEVVFLTTQMKKPLPTHVTIMSTGRRSTALCEQITSVSVDRLENYKCHVTLDEMLLVDQALATSVGIAARGGTKNTDRSHPNDERLLALVCLRYLQNIIGPGFKLEVGCGAQPEEKRKFRRREHERTP